MNTENKEVRKLELCDIAPYLPYQLRIKCADTGEDLLMNGLSGDSTIEATTIINGEEFARLLAIDKSEDAQEYGIPYLRPTNQIAEEIEHNGEKVNVSYIIEEMDSMSLRWILCGDCSEVRWDIIKILLKYHFDIANLIPSGLAIPIHNTK